MLVFRGAFVHTLQYGSMDLMLDKVLVVDKARRDLPTHWSLPHLDAFSQGIIIKVAPGSKEKEVLDEFKLEPSCVRR